MKIECPSTVGRKKQLNIKIDENVTEKRKNGANLFLGNSLDFYDMWEPPTVIISDGAYGLLGFDGDTSDHLQLPEWYEPHIKAWSKRATNQTTLWFFNSEIGWASVHPVLEKYGWRYINANIWNKGKGHIAGNINTKKIRRFPVVTEMCVQYVFETKINNQSIQQWLLSEWERTGLPLKEANKACGVKDAATRKYFNQGHLWYFPPVERFEKLVEYANKYGNPDNKPYYSTNGEKPISKFEWEKMRAKFNCPHGYTNVWDRPPLNGTERIKIPSGSKSAHLNQKPLDIMQLLIEASSEFKDVIWEPFGGLFSASVAATNLNRIAYGAEIDPMYYKVGIERF